ncbi:receptor activity-modifying protein 1-like [Nematolebias whitei]|uniref:receptor activity-modifying protein 1-like n=1 Tax=Nematolebias whitei TaxID=451745 RepID=UPI001896DC7D|nr:receptor activity-modifying protein 1-like [Nematolebias whitei]
MTLCLLLPALVLGVTVPPSANTTEETLDVWRNRTVQVYTTNSPTEPNGPTAELEGERRRNQSSAVLTEDDERFQNQEVQSTRRHCDRVQLLELSHSYCGAKFQDDLQQLDAADWCVLENVIGPYNDLTVCLETLTAMVDCYFPNRDIQDFFVHIHSSFFHNCTEEEEDLCEDAPTSLVVALTIIPVSFIPVLVYLVVWKR